MNQESEQNEIDGVKKGADSTGEVMQYGRKNGKIVACLSDKNFLHSIVVYL